MFYASKYKYLLVYDLRWKLGHWQMRTGANLCVLTGAFRPWTGTAGSIIIDQKNKQVHLDGEKITRCSKTMCSQKYETFVTVCLCRKIWNPYTEMSPYLRN